MLLIWVCDVVKLWSPSFFMYLNVLQGPVNKIDSLDRSLGLKVT